MKMGVHVACTCIREDRKLTTSAITCPFICQSFAGGYCCLWPSYDKLVETVAVTIVVITAEIVLYHVERFAAVIEHDGFNRNNTLLSINVIRV